MHLCPNCGLEIQDIECPNCGFNFNDLIDCPKRISNRCVHTKRPCEVQGLNYESCPVFIKYTGLDFFQK